MSQDFKFSHLPVLFEECMEQLSIRPDGIYVDCTAGGGGHSGGIYDRLGPKGRLISFDKDEAALKACEIVRAKKQKSAVWTLVRSDFQKVADVLKEMNIDKVDGILADLGVSSHQLDTADRGFSYAAEGPLDMRMNKDQMISARTVVNTYGEDELVRIYRQFVKKDMRGG